MKKVFVTIWSIIWYAWRNRRGLTRLRDEIVEFYNITRKALEDKKICKEEAILIAQSANDIFPAIINLLGGKV